MKAADIKPGLYAVKFRDKIVRFTVETIETVSRRKADRSHSSSSSVIEGRINPEDLPEGLSQEERENALQLKSLAPETILGRYTEYTELRQKEEAREAERKAELKREKDESLEIVRWLYRMAGQQPPKDEKALEDYHAPIRSTYGGTVEIHRAGVELLFKAFKGEQP